jgi:outer membrane protein TolC
MHKVNKLLLYTLLPLWGLGGFAQESFTVKDAVKYAIKNNLNVKNAELEILSADTRIKEIRAAGLPQISGQFQYTASPIVASSLIDPSRFSFGAAPNPNDPKPEPVKVQFGLPFAGQAGIGVNQLIYDATWLLGLKAAPIYRELAKKSVDNSKISVAENVMKAYYSVLVAEERIQILDLNMGRLDSLIREMRIMNQQGFVEKIDLSRLEVQRNNLLTERQKVQNLIQLTYGLLKFQMGMRGDASIKLTEKLSDIDLVPLQALDYQPVDYANRIEYSSLMTQRELQEIDLQRTQKGVIPKLFFSGSLGASHSNTQFNPFKYWFGVSQVSIGMQVPIYDSGLRKYQQQQQRITLTRVDQSAQLLRQSFDLQNQQAIISLKNGLQSLDIQKRNLELAQEVIRVSKIKYQSGVGSNLEVVNAEASLKEAQTNYFAALYDVIIAKVDLDKALGKLSID